MKNIIFLTAFMLVSLFHFASGANQKREPSYGRENPNRNAYQIQRQANLSIGDLKKAIRKAKDNGQVKKAMQATLQLSAFYLSKRQYDSCFKLNKQIVDEAQKNHWTSLEISASIGLGMVSFRDDKLSDALKYFRHAKILTEKSGNTQQSAVILMNLGMSYRKLKDLPKAVASYHQGVHFARLHHNTHLLRSLYQHLAGTYIRLNQPDSANFYRSKANEIRIQDKPDATTTHQLIQKAEAKIEEEKFKAAQQLYQRAFELAKLKNDTLMMTNLLIWQAKTLLLLGQPDAVIQISSRVKKLGAHLDNRYDFESYFSTLISAWKQKKNPEAALQVVERRSKVRQKAFNLQRQNYLIEARTKYKTDLNKKQLLELQNQSLQKDLDMARQKNQLNTLLGSLFTLLILMGVFIWFYFYKQKKQQSIHRQKEKALRSEREASAAQALLIGEEKERRRIARELHDGLGILLSSAQLHFSNLSLDPYFNKHDSFNKAAGLLKKAGTEARRISHNMIPISLSKFGLKEALEDLCQDITDSHAIRINTNISAGLHLSEDMGISIYRIVQELLNNTLKHAQATTIHLECNKKDRQLMFRYTDDGIGFNQKSQQTAKGIGLAGIRSRIAFLKGKYSLFSKPGFGFHLELQLPC